MARGGHSVRGERRDGLSHHVADLSNPSSLSNENMVVLEPPAFQISDCSNDLPLSNSEISTFENNAVSVV